MKFPRIGRPLKYRHFIEALDDDTIYTPASIVQLGEIKGLFPRALKDRDLYDAKLRVRHTLARFSSNHHFPYMGDGLACLEGHPPMRGWKGSRWKLAADIAPSLEGHHG